MERFDRAYRQVAEAEDRCRAIRGLRDPDLVAALAACSRHEDPYLANVLATEALNRLRRRRSATVALVVAVVGLVIVRTAYLLRGGEGAALFAGGSLAVAALVGLVVYRASRSR